MHRSIRLVARRPALSAVVIVACLFMVSSNAGAVIRYVDPNSPGPTHNGTSWTFAYTSLQTALAAANSGDQIWVADGVYKPTTTNDRSATFSLPPGVKIFGGFAGSPVFESILGQRILGAFPSILSGEIGSLFSDSDNSYHVVTCPAGVTTTMHLDGFTISGGHANGGGIDDVGGGMRNVGSPFVRNCRFVDNFAAVAGGGVFNGSAPSNSAFHNCVFAQNDAGVASAMDNQNNATVIVNCTIATNDSPALRFLNGAATSIIRNSILSDNSGSSQGSQIVVTNSTVSVSSCCIEGWNGSLGGSGNFGADPRLHITSGGLPPFTSLTTNGTLLPGSPCIDAGNNALLPTDGDDLDSDGNTTETVPYDMVSTARRLNDFVIDTGSGTAPIVDIGAVEFVRTERVILVNHAATGANNGTTWQDAYTNLQSALAELADVKFGGPGQIWVAQGTYKPTTTTSRSVSFEMVSGVRMYGGFIGDGTEGGLHQRDFSAHPTILSGDIGVAGNHADNSYHVVTSDGAGYFATPALDGFVITRGNANGASPNNGGGGMRCFTATSFDPEIRNCRFIANAAGTLGGGAFVSSGAEPLLLNCTFSSNTSTAAGQAIRMFNTSVPRIVNCTITSHEFPAVRLTNAANAIVKNSIIYGNGNGTESNQISIDALTTPAVSNCIIQGWTGVLGGANNTGADPLLADPNGADNLFGTLDDDVRLSSCSPAIDSADLSNMPTDPDDVDTNGSTTGLFPIDLDASDRLDDDTAVSPNTPPLGAEPMDRGAYEFHGTSGGPCPTDCAPVPAGDGQVNVLDLLMVINTWGAGPAAGDVAPPCGDGLISVTDLLAVINAWGPCP